MKNILHIVGSGIALGMFLFFIMIATAHAETRMLGNIVIDSDTVWEASDSPYLIDGVVTVLGATLTIGPGVEVVGIGDNPRGRSRLDVSDGTLVVQGATDRRVLIHNMYSIFVFEGGSVALENADIYDMFKGISLDGSRAVVASSSISRSISGIDIRSSGLSMWGSSISSTTEGIKIFRSPGPFQVRGEPSLFTGGIGNALDDLEVGVTDVGITGSIFAHNGTAINSIDWVPIFATNNWWGSPAGPGRNNGGEVIMGKVTYDPWLTTEPSLFPKKTTCCSSILFIPGIEASRLYRPEASVIARGTTTNRLWEPNRNDDVRKLFLDNTGSSTDGSIYAGGPITKALGLRDIYGSFMGSLDDLVARGVIGEWSSYGYDWRKPISEVVLGTERRATSSDSLISTLESLAMRSRTGKVTLVAHSNGGLVAKYLVKALTDIGKQNLVDSVISVAVPYIGTPQAILGLLHGDDQSIAGGALLKAGVARELGINMPSAYSLLPSAAYFSRVFGPTIVFASTTIAGVNDGTYRPADAVSTQTEFILDPKNVHVGATTTLAIPARGNRTLMTAATAVHSILDSFVWPTSIARWALVGWGNPTARAIEYLTKTSCVRGLIGMKCSKVATHTASTTVMGDGTVVVPSASYDSGTVVALDLVNESMRENRNIDHSNILGASTSMSAIEKIISSGQSRAVDSVADEVSRLPGVSIGDMASSKDQATIRVSTHSPVELHVYDSQGRHTGVVPVPQGTDEAIEAGLYTFFDEAIPGSHFEQYGEDDQEMYITLPDDQVRKYSIRIEGKGVGEFTYKVERLRGDRIVDSVEFAGLPVTPLTVATTTILSDDPRGSTTTPLTVSLPPLAIDVEGNGSPDIIVRPNTAFDPIIHLESLKKTLIFLIGSKHKRTVDITRRIDRLETLIKKGDTKKIVFRAAQLKKFAYHKKGKYLTSADKSRIVDMIDAFIAQYE